MLLHMALSQSFLWLSILQYSCLENPMDGGAWWAAVHEVTKSQTWLSNWTEWHHFISQRKMVRHQDSKHLTQGQAAMKPRGEKPGMYLVGACSISLCSTQFFQQGKHQETRDSLGRFLGGRVKRGKELGTADQRESDTTEWLHFHFSLSCIGEGNGNPLQCSCLESPRDGGAWWAAIYGVAQSWTQLKRLSSSSSSSPEINYCKKGLARLQVWSQPGCLWRGAAKRKCQTTVKEGVTKPENQVCLEHESVKGVRDIWEGKAVVQWLTFLIQISTKTELQNPESQDLRHLLPAPSRSASTTTVQDAKLVRHNLFP